ncbi:hypothetical protein PSQ19_10965 [Devosia algicola]|uniref:Uncharacterized protein n=1 Tax=Devosia algicola TaxID=3026418 RepID=A0ABY7YJI7_9HYPH|nr:hypothetical protein [Devosia algicola]WDR01347.1 hypothetical protein PSQ19_10965 [Devosia algicola]
MIVIGILDNGRPVGSTRIERCRALLHKPPPGGANIVVITGLGQGQIVKYPFLMDRQIRPTRTIAKSRLNHNTSVGIAVLDDVEIVGVS